MDAPRTERSNTRMDPLRVYDYLVASRAKLFDWIRPLPPERYNEAHPIGLGSLARTLHHVRAAEWHYMERIRGRTGPFESPAPELDPDIPGGTPLPFDALEPAWAGQAAQTRADLARVADWRAQRTYTTTWDGGSYAYRASPSDIFVQLALHEVHHRAQALHMLRRLGVETGEIDYNTMMWTPVGPG